MQNYDQNKGNLQTLLGNHIDRISNTISNPAGDDAQIDAELLLLDALGFPVLVTDQKFKDAMQSLNQQELIGTCPPELYASVRRPDGIRDHQWERMKRYNQIKLIIWSLYNKNVLQRAAIVHDDLGL